VGLLLPTTNETARSRSRAGCQWLLVCLLSVLSVRFDFVFNVGRTYYVSPIFFLKGYVVTTKVKPQWEDVSSFSQNDKERIPNCFAIRFGDRSLKLTVHRHIHYKPDQWLASCQPDLFRQKLLESKDIEEAKVEALHRLKAMLTEITGDLDSLAPFKKTTKKTKK
jgi:hypothetical protein